MAYGSYVPPPIDGSLQGATPYMPPGATQAQYTPIDPTQMQALNSPGYQQQALNPALAASVIGLNSNASQQASIDRQRRMADQMRADAKSQMSGVQAGRIYVAPGIANMLGSAANSFGAANMNQNADTSTGVMNQQRQDALTQYFNALTGSNNSGANANAGAGP